MTAAATTPSHAWIGSLQAELDALEAALLRGDAPGVERASAAMQAVLQQHEAQEGDAAVQKLQAAETRFMANERGRYGVHELTEGVLYSELQPGTGVQPKAGGKVQVRYVGRLPDGSIFDQNQTPQWFNLDSVIEGWQVALPKMHTGAKWRLVIPSAQAYGAEGAGDLIAPYTPGVCEIELLAVGD